LLKYKILLSIALTATLSATTITGIGYAPTQKDAKKEALADLSNKISVDVKSVFKTITKSMGQEYSKEKENSINISSNLPLKGIEFDILVGNILIKSTAKLTTQKALDIYKLELKKLKKNIAHSVLELENIKNDTMKYTILNQLLKDIQSFNKHKTVAILLNGKSLPTLDISKSEILIQLQKLNSNIPSLKIASEVLTKDIKQQNIYLSTIKPSGSNEVTQFAKILKENMSVNLNTTKRSFEADYFLRGSYEILKNNIFITINLSDENNNILKTITATLDKKAYQDMRYKPSIKTFDDAINSEFVKNGKLSVSIGFKGYNRENGIDLNQGDTVDIVIKTNKPMCYFLIGHTLKDDDKFSYILPIGSDESPFINSITGEDVNRNITIIDEVPIEAPFGSENLQIFASTFIKKGKCPLITPKSKENDDGYSIIAGKPNEVINSTRALNIGKKKFKIEKAESNISFSSFK
jgi:hypothetical protein